MKPTPESGEDLAALLESAGGRWSWRKRLIVSGVVLGGLGWWISSAMSGPENTGPVYTEEALKVADLSLLVTATGNLEPTNQVTIGSELSGTTLEVYVDVNDRVTKGQPLAKLDTSRLARQTESSRAALSAAKARVNQAEATLHESEATLARKRELHKLSGGESPSKADMLTAEAAAARGVADLDNAKASVEQAEAQVRINENDLAKAVIKSPIDGIVLSRKLEPGQTVAASFTAPELFVLAENLENMKLKVAIAEADIGRLDKGQPATFTVDAWPDRTFTATVTRVSFGSTVTTNVVTYETELEVPNKDLSLRPGMTATADVRVAETKAALLAPAAAFRFDPADAKKAAAGAKGPGFLAKLLPAPRGRPNPTGKEEPAKLVTVPGESIVWVLEKGEPVQVKVKTGLSNGKLTEITAGLNKDQKVVTRAVAQPS